MHHWGYFHPFGFVFGFIFFLLLVGLFIANVRMWRGRRSGCYADSRYDSRLILDKRLASGEIGIEEYERLKEILKN